MQDPQQNTNLLTLSDFFVFVRRWLVLFLATTLAGIAAGAMVWRRDLRGYESEAWLPGQASFTFIAKQGTVEGSYLRVARVYGKDFSDATLRRLDELAASANPLHDDAAKAKAAMAKILNVPAEGPVEQVLPAYLNDTLQFEKAVLASHYGYYFWVQPSASPAGYVVSTRLKEPGAGAVLIKALAAGLDAGIRKQNLVEGQQREAERALRLKEALAALDTELDLTEQGRAALRDEALDNWTKLFTLENKVASLEQKAGLTRELTHLLPASRDKDTDPEAPLITELRLRIARLLADGHADAAPVRDAAGDLAKLERAAIRQSPEGSIAQLRIAAARTKYTKSLAEILAYNDPANYSLPPIERTNDELQINTRRTDEIGAGAAKTVTLGALAGLAVGIFVSMLLNLFWRSKPAKHS